MRLEKLIEDSGERNFSASKLENNRTIGEIFLAKE